jgi:DNA replication protein DnaC
MNKNILNEVLREYEKKHDRAILDQQRRQKEVYDKVPEIKKIDEKISKVGIDVSRAIIYNPESYKENALKAKEKLEKLKMRKAVLLTENNIPLEYLDVNYECNKCKDTGYLPTGERCNCLKQKLVNIAYKMSNLENVLEKENFQTFDISIFSDKKFENEKLTPRENMMDILSRCEGFVNNFDENNDENLLFYGTTGLGKTFMCNCIAKSLLDKNKIVVYQTAFRILEIVENHRFNRRPDNFLHFDYELLFDADLLIIDDLGTEVTNTFTNAEIFNIVNSRIIKGNKTIISTNLTPKEIADIYTDRIFSRILEKFIPLKFYGPDLRWESIKNS